MDYVPFLINPISNEYKLRYFKRNAVKNAILKLVNIMSENALLQKRPSLHRTVIFEDHTNFGAADGNLFEPFEQINFWAQFGN